MIIDSNNKVKRSILTNKCFYQTTAKIMRHFEDKGYVNSADETIKAFAAYRSIVQRKIKNNYNSDYNIAFKFIDDAINTLANQVFYDCDKKGLDYAYKSFENFDHVKAIISRKRSHKNSA